MNKQLLLILSISLFLFFPLHASAETQDLRSCEDTLRATDACVQPAQFKPQIEEFLELYQTSGCFGHNKTLQELVDQLAVDKDTSRVRELWSLLTNMNGACSGVLGYMRGYITTSTSCGCEPYRTDLYSNYNSVIQAQFVKIITNNADPVEIKGVAFIWPETLPTATPIPIHANDLNLPKQLSGNCGGVGDIKCCDVEALMSDIANVPPDVFPGTSFFGEIIGFVTESVLGKAKQGMTESALGEISAVSSEQTLCIKGYFQPYLETSKGSMLALNKYDLENKSYIIKEDCSKYLISGESGKYEDCSAKGPRFIKKSDVVSCSCSDPDGESNLDPRVSNSATDFQHDPKMIFKQICKGIKACEECLSKSTSQPGITWQWQPWIGRTGADTKDPRCIESLEDANVNLDKEISIIKESSQTEKIYAMLNANKNPNVLAAQDVCSVVKDDTERGACIACKYSGKFWNRAGCTDKPLRTLETRRLCQNIEDSVEKQKCVNCSYEGGNWTAIGCIQPNIAIFIRQQLFGIGLGIAGTFALGCIMYAGFLLQTSTGDPEKVKKAQELMTSCITGLIIIIFSIVILRIIGVDILRLPGLS